MKRAQSQEDKAKRQESILLAALSQFSEKGIQATRMEDIAREAGVSKGTLYLYFESKDALFAALIQDYAGKRLVWMLQAVSLQTNSREALRVWVKSVASALTQERMSHLVILLLANARQFPEMVDLYKETMLNRGLAEIVSLLQRGVETGEFKAHDSALFARLVMAPALMEVIFQSLFVRDAPLQQGDVEVLLLTQLEMIFTYLR